jgi:hypothetical protein
MTDDANLYLNAVPDMLSLLLLVSRLFGAGETSPSFFQEGSMPTILLGTALVQPESSEAFSEGFITLAGRRACVGSRGKRSVCIRAVR